MFHAADFPHLEGLLDELLHGICHGLTKGSRTLPYNEQIEENGGTTKVRDHLISLISNAALSLQGRPTSRDILHGLRVAQLEESE